MKPEEESRLPVNSAPPLTARVISPGDHPITREMINQDALYVMQKLNKAGFSAYLVGGGVRDIYLA